MQVAALPGLGLDLQPVSLRACLCQLCTVCVLELEAGATCCRAQRHPVAGLPGVSGALAPHRGLVSVSAPQRVPSPGYFRPPLPPPSAPGAGARPGGSPGGPGSAAQLCPPASQDREQLREEKEKLKEEARRAREEARRRKEEARELREKERREKRAKGEQERAEKQRRREERRRERQEALE